MRRVFTDGEIAYATSTPALAAERLAARFAAKEAAIKALGLVERGIGWREIEVDARSRRAAAGCRCTARRATPPTKPAWSSSRVSLSHEGDYAAAVVLAMRERRRPQQRMMIDKIRKILKDHGRLNKDAVRARRGRRSLPGRA